MESASTTEAPRAFGACYLVSVEEPRYGAVPDGGASTLTVSQGAGVGHFYYGAFSHVSGTALEGDDGNDPTIIID